MTIPKFFDGYIRWLQDRVGNNGYFFLLQELAQIEFYCVNDKDEARLLDASALRSEYINSHLECDWLLPVCAYLEQAPISVLEVLVHLAEKIETDAMFRPDEFNVSKRFYRFIDNLGLSGLTDSNWSEEGLIYLRKRIDIFLTHEYDFNGEGGNIFVCKKEDIAPFDMRNMSLWEQVNSWLRRCSLDLEVD